MPYGQFNEESLFFVQVESLIKGPAITCDQHTSVIDAARLMQQHDISGLIVLADGTPKGVFSVRNLRNFVAGGSLLPEAEQVANHMSSGLVTLHHTAYVFEAIFKMAKHNIHRLALLDGKGQLFGVLTDTDLLRARTRTPLYLNQEIEAAESIEQLRDLSAKLLETIRFATRAGADARSLVQLISHFNDSFTQRIIALLEEQEGIVLPEGVAYLVLGSEGRNEQTLRTDQDSAIVYRDDLPASAQEAIARFSSRLVDALEQVGVPRCPGDTMASNPQWRHSLSEWKAIVEEWINTPKPENMVNFGMFQDLRTLHGDPGLEVELRQHICQSVQDCMLFLPHMARHIVRFTPPLGMFGRIKGESRGEHRGKVDLKKGGIFALTVGISLIALEAGIVGGSTWSKLDQLEEQNVLSAVDLGVLEESFTFLVHLRLQRQLRSFSEGKVPGNHVDPLVISDRQREQLRSALKGVNSLFKILSDRYRLNSLAR
jgi:CBS domain-containing protein